MKRIVISILAVVFLTPVGNSHGESLLLSAVGPEDGTRGFRIVQAWSKEIGRRSGIEIELVGLPAMRANRLISKGLIDGDIARIAGYETKIQGIIKIPEPIHTAPYFAYTAGLKFKVDGWESLAPYRVVYPRGFALIELNLKPIHPNLEEVGSVKQALLFLAANRADVYVSTPDAISTYLQLPKIKEANIEPLQPPVSIIHSYIYLLKKHLNVSAKISIALTSMKEDGTYRRIFATTQ